MAAPIIEIRDALRSLVSGASPLNGTAYTVHGAKYDAQVDITELAAPIVIVAVLADEGAEMISRRYLRTDHHLTVLVQQQWPSTDAGVDVLVNLVWDLSLLLEPGTTLAGREITAIRVPQYFVPVMMRDDRVFMSGIVITVAGDS